MRFCMLSRVTHKLWIIQTLALASGLAGMMVKGGLCGSFSAGCRRVGGIAVRSRINVIRRRSNMILFAGGMALSHLTPHVVC